MAYGEGLDGAFADVIIHGIFAMVQIDGQSFLLVFLIKHLNRSLIRMNDWVLEQIQV